jgi:hypothetical protein
MRERGTEGTSGAEVALPAATDSVDRNRATISGDVAEVAGLLQAQPARRDDLITELHRSRGNAFVQQVLATLDPKGQDGNGQPGLLWDRQDAGSGVSETRNSADSSKKQDRRPRSERLAEASDNATYHAMNTELKLLAYELGAAGKQLTQGIGFSTAKTKADKTQVEETDKRLMAIISPLDERARDLAKQLGDLNTPKMEPRLEDGAQALMAALDEFAPVREQVDTWMTSFTGDTPSWEVLGRSRGILKLVFPNLAPNAKPLTAAERSPGTMQDDAINAHLDAAIAAAESAKSGNAILEEDRIKLHARELARLLKDQPRVEGQLAPRIKTLVKLVDQVIENEPWLKTFVNEAIDPIRNVK